MSAGLAPFAELVGRPDARIDLAQACLMIAEDAYPGLDFSSTRWAFEATPRITTTRATAT